MGAFDPSFDYAFGRARSGDLPETIRFCAAMTTPPNSARRSRINTLIGTLITEGIWQKLGALFVFESHDQQSALLEWKLPTHTATAVNSPTFVADTGFSSNGTTSYIDTNISWSTAVIAFVGGVGSRHLSPSSGFGLFAARVLANPPHIFYHATSGNETFRHANSSSANNAVNADIAGAGALLTVHVYRPDASNFSYGINGAAPSTVANAANNSTSTNITVFYNNTTYSDPSHIQKALWTTPILLTDAQQTAMHNAMLAWESGLAGDYP